MRNHTGTVTLIAMLIGSGAAWAGNSRPLQPFGQALGTVLGNMANQSVQQQQSVVPTGLPACFGQWVTAGNGFLMCQCADGASAQLVEGQLICAMAQQTTQPTPQPGELSSDQIQLVQQLLNRRGFDVGTPDGIVGPKTSAVVSQLQAKAGVPVTGVPTQQLLDALNGAN